MKKLLLVTATATLLTISAQAVQINGTIDIGAFDSTVTINKALNTVTFVDSGNLPGANAVVNSATGNFVPFVLQQVNYANFSYSPLTVVNPLWQLSIGGLSFDLLSITSIDEGVPGLELHGSGIIHSALYEDTVGNWSFSANTTGTKFTFSSQTSTVPDGGTTVMLLGAALSGLGLIRRKLVA